MHVAVRADSFHRKPNTSSKDNNPSLSVRREHSGGIRNLEKKTFSLSFSEEEVTPTGENRDGLVHLRKDSVVSTNEPEKKKHNFKGYTLLSFSPRTVSVYTECLGFSSRCHTSFMKLRG